jgi:FkbM family methyltransferase
MEYVESLALSVIKVSRKYFRNTWVHRLPFTSWLYKKIFALSQSGEEKKVRFRGKQFFVSTKDTSMVPSIINQDYEDFELDIFERIILPGMTVLDIGANLGIYSVIGNDLVGASGTVYAFEPVPENVELLKRNLGINHARQVKIVPKAIGDKVGKMEINLAKDSIGTHTMGGSSDTSINVGVETIDSYVKRNNIKPDFIKMDIEGYEGYALRGATELLSKKNVSLLIEFAAKLIKQCGDEPSKIAKLLLKNFKYCYIIDERSRELIPVTKYEELSKLENSNLLLSHRALALKS